MKGEWLCANPRSQPDIADIEVAVIGEIHLLFLLSSGVLHDMIM